MEPDDDEMGDDVRQLLSGIIVTIYDHKTGVKGPVEAWVNTKDEVFLRAIMALNDRYAEQTGKDYPGSSQLFINSQLKPLRSATNQRAIDFSRFAKIAGVKHFHSHDSRHMWTDALSNQQSLLLREAAAVAANHSLETQQRYYVSNYLTTLKKVGLLAFKLSLIIILFIYFKFTVI